MFDVIQVLLMCILFLAMVRWNWRLLVGLGLVVAMMMKMRRKSFVAGLCSFVVHCCPIHVDLFCGQRWRISVTRCRRSSRQS